MLTADSGFDLRSDGRAGTRRGAVSPFGGDHVKHEVTKETDACMQLLIHPLCIYIYVHTYIHKDIYVYIYMHVCVCSEICTDQIMHRTNLFF